jgi:hypothetical protein
MAYIIGALVFVAISLGAITAIAAVEMLTQRKIAIEKTDPDPRFNRRWHAFVADLHRRAQANGFTFAGYYKVKLGLHTVLTAVWQRPDRPTLILTYAVSKPGIMDIATEFADHVSLTSGTTRDGQLFPKPPCVYHQSFSDVAFEQLWSMHIEMENYLIDAGGARLIPQKIDIEINIADDALRSNAYVRSLPFWYLRTAWWFFVRRYRWHGLSVKQQHEQSMILLPNELAAAGTLTTLNVTQLREDEA